MMPPVRTRSSRTTKVERTTGGESGVKKSTEERTTSQSGTLSSQGMTTKRYHYEMSSSGGERSSGGAASYGVSSSSGIASGSAAASGSTYRSNVTVTRSGRSRSPLRITREEEKDELVSLNDRLALYIEYVKQLGLKNKDLVKKFKSVSQVETTDVESIKGMFEDELQSLRRALDAMAKDRAILEVENRKMRAEWDDMKAKLARKEMEVRALERKIEQYEKELSESRLDRERYLSLKREYDQEIKQIDELKRALEHETIARTECEAKVNSLKMEIEFQNNLHKEEKSKWFTRTIEIEEEVEDRTKSDYDSRLAAELHLMREQTAEEMRLYKMEIENTFHTKFADLKTTSDRSMGDIARSRDELYTIRKRYDEVNAELAKKQAEVESLMSRVGDLEKLLEQERGDFESQLRIYREENRALRSEMEKRFKEFNELMAIKINLDNEIQAYRLLLESEELRCNLTHEEREAFVRSRHVTHAVDMDEEELADVDMGSGGSSSVGSSGHYSVKTSNSGPIEISKCDVGLSVTLRNSSVEDVVIGGWQLRYEADGKETTYKFPRNLTVKADDSCTVWSSETHTTHNPPHDLVMKGLTFFSGSNVKIYLINKDDEELAVCEMDRDFSRRTTTTYTTRRTGIHSTRAGSEERCSVM